MTDPAPSSPAPAPRPLRRARRPLLVVHIVSSVGLLGAVASSLLLVGLAADGQVASHAAYELINRQAFVLGLPLSAVSLLSGILLGRATKWRTLTYRWTIAKLILQVAVVVNGALVLRPLISARLNGEGSTAALIGAEAVAAAMLLAAVVLTVFKPWGRLRPVWR